MKSEKKQQGVSCGDLEMSLKRQTLIELLETKVENCGKDENMAQKIRLLREKVRFRETSVKAERAAIEAAKHGLAMMAAKAENL